MSFHIEPVWISIVPIIILVVFWLYIEYFSRKTGRLFTEILETQKRLAESVGTLAGYDRESIDRILGDLDDIKEQVGSR